MARVRHTMHLFGGEVVLGYGDSKRIAMKDCGGEMFFSLRDGGVDLTIAVSAVEYVETESVE